MARYRKILVAFDGSPSGVNALRQAIRLSETERSWIKVVAVVPAFDGDINITGVKDLGSVLMGSAEKIIASAKEVAREEGANVVTHIESGEPYEKIIDVAEEENCDIIVIGRQGRHSLERALMGSVTARVIGYSSKDVLIIPKDGSVDLKCILLATDGSAHSDAAAERAIDFAASYGSELRCLSVVDVPPESYAEAHNAVEKMMEKAKGFACTVKNRAEAAGVKASCTAADGDAHEVILDYASKEGVNIIVMGSHGRTGLSRLLMGSVAEKVIGLAPCPVLVVRR